MSDTKMFKYYLKHLAEYQNNLLPDNRLEKDYMIIYEYLMDLLQLDTIIGELLVRKKLQISNINADILLDVARIFDIRSFIHAPYLCLTLTDRDNKRFDNVPHPFCNEKQSIVPRNIKKSVWLALNKGLLTSGSFVRGYQGDIYEINLCPSDYNEIYIRVNAHSDEVNLIINLRVLINYSRNPYREPGSCKPYPPNELNREWFAMLPKLLNSPFEVCLPKLEHEMKQMCFELVMILRMKKFYFKKHEKLSFLYPTLLESIIYGEYVNNIRSTKKTSKSIDYMFIGVLMRIAKALKTKNCPCFWNERLNLMKPVDKFSSIPNASRELYYLIDDIKRLRSSDSLKYDEFYEIFDFKMEPFSFEIDQFGIFKSY